MITRRKPSRQRTLNPFIVRTKRRTPRINKAEIENGIDNLSNIAYILKEEFDKKASRPLTQQLLKSPEIH